MSSAEQWAQEKSLQSSNFTLKLRETEYEAGKGKRKTGRKGSEAEG